MAELSGALLAGREESKAGDEGFEEAHGIFGVNVILQGFGQEWALEAVQAATLFHRCLGWRPGVEHSKKMKEFSHSLAEQPPLNG